MSIALQPDGAEVSYRWPICKQVSQVRTIFSYVVVVSMLRADSLHPRIFDTIFLSEEGRFCQIWNIIIRLDGWKRGAFYCLASLPMFFLSYVSPFGMLLAFLLLVLGLLYVSTKFAITTFTIPPPTSFSAAGGPAAYNPQSGVGIPGAGQEYPSYNN
uniref:Uncharacterized protein n=1 Tax=Romanomermis culicivorax TaxID=13658 RepID=A0A915I2W9_ROMCU